MLASKIQRNCPRCGVSEEKSPFIDELCVECRLKDLRLSWPSLVEFARCPKCSRIWRDRTWKPTAPSLIASVVQKKMERAGLEGHYNIEAGMWEGVWRAGGVSVPYTHVVRIAYEGQQCTECERSSGNYHEAIVQLRGDPARVASALKRISRRLEHRTFIAKVVPMHGGEDIYVGVKKDVEEIIRRENYKFVRTEKLVGQKEGGRLYRTTFLVRLDAEGAEEKEPEVKEPRRFRAKK